MCYGIKTSFVVLVPDRRSTQTNATTVVVCIHFISSELSLSLRLLSSFSFSFYLKLILILRLSLILCFFFLSNVFLYYFMSKRYSLGAYRPFLLFTQFLCLFISIFAYIFSFSLCLYYFYFRLYAFSVSLLSYFCIYIFSSKHLFLFSLLLLILSHFLEALPSKRSFLT